MVKKLYVGNLNFTMSGSDLQELFAPYGTVQSAKIVMDRTTNQSKGFGFVEMASDEEADAAIAALNGTDRGGRTLKVNEAKSRTSSEAFVAVATASTPLVAAAAIAEPIAAPW